jgi:hypothetical protein
MFMSTLRVQFRMIHMTIQPWSNMSEMQTPCSENDSRNDVVITEWEESYAALIPASLIKSDQGSQRSYELHRIAFGRPVYKIRNAHWLLDTLTRIFAPESPLPPNFMVQNPWKAVVTQLVKKFRAFMQPDSSSPCSQGPTVGSLSWARWNQSKPKYSIS